MSGVKVAPEALAAEAQTMSDAADCWQAAGDALKHNRMDWNTLGILGLGIPELFNQAMEVFAARLTDGVKAIRSTGEGFAEAARLYAEKDEEYYRKLGYTGEF